VTEAYNGGMMLLLDYDIESEKLLSLEVLKHQETYNYGGYATEEWFTQRFAEKSVARDLKVVKLAAREPQDIAVITGATITTAAIVDGVNRGFHVFRKHKEGNR
jgi:electron transport complex protein RnfG